MGLSTEVVNDLIVALLVRAYFRIAFGYQNFEEKGFNFSKSDSN